MSLDFYNSYCNVILLLYDLPYESGAGKSAYLKQRKEISISLFSIQRSNVLLGVTYSSKRPSID